MPLPLDALELPIVDQAWKRVSRAVGSHIDGFSRVRTYGYGRAGFLEHSYACHLIGWSESEPYEWWDAQQRIHHLTAHPDEIANLSSYAIETATEPADPPDIREVRPHRLRTGYPRAHLRLSVWPARSACGVPGCVRRPGQLVAAPRAARLLSGRRQRGARRSGFAGV